MKYRIIHDIDCYKVQRKVFLVWRYLDNTNSWDNWFVNKSFPTYQSAKNFIDSLCKTYK